MSKRLKTLILVSSLFIVFLLLGVVLLSVFSNATSTEIYDFRLYEMPATAVTDTSYSTSRYYLSSTENNHDYAYKNDYIDKVKNIYSFDVINTDIAEVITSAADGLYYLRVKKVGSTQITITGAGTVQTDTIYVYKELAIKDLYLNSDGNNFMPFSIRQSASAGAANVLFTSSNPQIAKVIVKNGVYYINYLSVGTATITAYCDGNTAVSDKIIVNVHDNRPNALNYVDKNGNIIDKFVMYTDGKEYKLNYSLIFGNTADNIVINSTNIELFYDNKAISLGQDDLVNPVITADTKAFDNGVRLDKDEKCIILKRSLTEDDSIIDYLSFVTLKTYIINSDGTKTATGAYTIPVYVYKYRCITLELEVSQIPNFSDTVKNIYNYTGTAWEGVEVNPVDKIYFSNGNEISSIFFRVWKAYNNGDREILESTNMSKQKLNDAKLLTNDMQTEKSYFYLSYKTTATITSITDLLTITRTGASDGVPTVVLTLQERIDINSTGGANYIIENLYTYENGVYTFKYFDQRFRLPSEKTDANGNIIGFN